MMEDDLIMGPYVPVAIHFEKADFLEYVARDVPTVTRQTDGNLDLLVTTDTREPVGWRIHGWSRIAPSSELQAAQRIRELEAERDDMAENAGNWCARADDAYGKIEELTALLREAMEGLGPFAESIYKLDDYLWGLPGEVGFHLGPDRIVHRISSDHFRTAASLHAKIAEWLKEADHIPDADKMVPPHPVTSNHVRARDDVTEAESSVTTGACPHCGSTLHGVS